MFDEEPDELIEIGWDFVCVGIKNNFVIINDVYDPSNVSYRIIEKQFTDFRFVWFVIAVLPLTSRCI